MEMWPISRDTSHTKINDNKGASMSKLSSIAIIPGKFITSCLLLTLATQIHAEDYVAVDAMYMDTRIAFANGTDDFNLTPLRIKYGRRYKEFGWEVHILTPSDDTTTFSGAPIVDDYELNYGVGLLMTVSTLNRRWYGGIGFTWIDTDYTDRSVPATTGTSYPFTTINIGGQFHINDRTRFTIDYTHYLGQIDCNFCTATGPNPSDPNVQISSIAAGISYTFD